ncbi:flap endonuclease-1 [Candidatus Micrarchaeota archaeon]|nr:flap endonuclease-1 [Candidatus Micrarchaeota archaeon]
MGVQLGDISEKRKIELEDLKDRVIAIDAFNSIYQFLSIIRQMDGTPLMDAEGRVTSHLSGLLYRTGKLFEAGIKPIYVFDGKPPVLKHKTIAERQEIKKEAVKKFEKAKSEGDVTSMKKYAQATSKLTGEMLEDSKNLLKAMGVPVVQAPSEGEAQAAFIAKNKDAWASASQDFDSLLFGSPRLIRNMTITGRRKLPGKNVFVLVEPELLELDEVLGSLCITHEQLVDIGILVGTDFNDGVKGIGPKKALDAVKNGKSADDVYKENGVEPDVDLSELRRLFLKPDVTNDYSIKFEAPNETRIYEILVEEHDFTRDRVEKVVEKLKETFENKGSQERLDKWFG